ncbi:MAG: hypothetical protein R3F15_19380 [Lysobacterales bacterium]
MVVLTVDFPLQLQVDRTLDESEQEIAIHMRDGQPNDISTFDHGLAGQRLNGARGNSEQRHRSCERDAMPPPLRPPGFHV